AASRSRTSWGEANAAGPAPLAPLPEAPGSARRDPAPALDAESAGGEAERAESKTNVPQTAAPLGAAPSAPAQLRIGGATRTVNLPRRRAVAPLPRRPVAPLPRRERRQHSRAAMKRCPSPPRASDR